MGVRSLDVVGIPTASSEDGYYLTYWDGEVLREKSLAGLIAEAADSDLVSGYSGAFGEVDSDGFWEEERRRYLEENDGHVPPVLRIKVEAEELPDSEALAFWERARSV